MVLYPRLDGTLVAAVGPVFSYYEFSLIGTKRLNDDEWKSMLDWGNHTEYLPVWFKDIYGTTDPFPTPEFPHITTVLIATMIITLATIVSRRIFRAKKTAAHI